MSNNQTPVFSGLAQEGLSEMTLRLYKGPTAEGTPIQQLHTSLNSDGSWALGPAKLLEDGAYTAQATQLTAMSETGMSSPVTFTVDTVAPTVTLNSPESPSSNTTPSFTGTASEAATPVIIRIHAGATVEGAMVSSATATGTGAGWTSGSASPALSPGQYTAVALQESSLGNPAGQSEAVTFTVTAAPVIVSAALTHAPPVASFMWFPPVPATGQSVTLVSTSTDPAGPIAGFRWALTSNGPFQPGGATLTTSFSAPGDHVVRLRVSNVYGLSSLATATINVITPTAFVMQPFPVVRIAGTESAFGVKLRLLKVQSLPADARITVRCRGRGCPIRSVTRVAASGRGGVAPIEFRRFERHLRFGVSLEILVSKPGEIGKYTRFVILRGKLPKRADMCLDLAGETPLACPSA